MKTSSVPAHGVARVNLAQCVIWFSASRRRFEAVRRLGEIASFHDGIFLAGETMLGVLALDQGLSHARWVITNDEAAVAALPKGVGPDEIERFWNTLRRVRNRMLVHFDERFASGEIESVHINSAGIFASNGLGVEYTEWVRWLDVLEPWANKLLAMPVKATEGSAVAPSRLGATDAARPRVKASAAKKRPQG